MPYVSMRQHASAYVKLGGAISSTESLELRKRKIREKKKSIFSHVRAYLKHTSNAYLR